MRIASNSGCLKDEKLMEASLNIPQLSVARFLLAGLARETTKFPFVLEYPAQGLNMPQKGVSIHDEVVLSDHVR